MHIMSPVAGRMRPKTRSSGIFRTKRKSPLKTSRLTRMLVPNPKNAFQSPGVHSAGFRSVIADPPPSIEGGQNSSRIRYPTENPALRLDHAQGHFVKLREVRTAAVARHDASVTAIVRFAHGGVDAHLGRDATYDERFDAAVP